MLKTGQDFRKYEKTIKEIRAQLRILKAKYFKISLTFGTFLKLLNPYILKESKSYY